MNEARRPRLGPFEIGGLIGTGGFASVYRAYDERLNCDVAIKILADNHALNPDVRERFIREAQALRQIDSPGVVSLYDIGETTDGRPYLVIELADRGGLIDRRRRCVNEGWQPNPGDVGHLVGALAAALEPVHAKQLVHRDVTPSNILIRSGVRSDDTTSSSLLAPDERFMLSDLGLVKDLAAGSGLTAGSGTVGFAAPEQQKPLTTIDGRSDVYSATAVVFWLIAGQSPRTVEDGAELLDRGGWPKPFIEAMIRGLAERPDDRHPTIGQWKADLISSLPWDTGRNEGRRTGANTQASSGRRLSGRRRLRSAGYVLFGVLAGAAAAAAAVTFWPDGLAATNSGSEESLASTSLDTPTEQLDQIEPTETVTAPVPDLQHFFFASRDDRTILTIIWGAPVLPPEVAATDIAVSVDGGDWVIETQADQSAARGWELYSTETGLPDRRPVTSESEYRAKVRWVLGDGTVTEWSRELAVATPS